MKIELISFGGAAPFREYNNDAGADLYANETVTVKPMQTVLVKSGIGIKIPKGYTAELRPRSSASKHGLLVHLGTIDSGYEDEIFICVTNLSDDDYVIEEGDRIAQLVMYPVILPEFTFDLFEKKRGANGFGSTGR